jgi:hypothetical protein
MNVQIKIGIAFIIFGVLIGGTGLASAGVGMSIPMIPIGIYLIVRGYKDDEHNKEQEKTTTHIKKITFEKTKLGKILLGILLIIIGIGTSSLIVGIPLSIYGLYLILIGTNKIKEFRI